MKLKLQAMLKPTLQLLVLTSIIPNCYGVKCHPLLASNRSQFIIGYGSLISESSKKNTLTNVDPNIPVRVLGYSRVWSMRAPQKKMTFLGVEEHPKKTFNGVIFSLNNAQISAFDKREIGYCRKKVPLQNIQFLSQQEKIDGDYWIYIPQKNCSQPYDKNNYPIASYYQQIFLSGCREIELKFHLKGFYKECLKDMPIG